MAELKEQSLDDTLKEILGDNIESKESAEDASGTEEKPKRTRRTKAQIEADMKAEQEAKKKPEEKPEVLEDTDLDKQDDIVETVSESASEDKPEELSPENVQDTELDTQPDVEDLTEKEPQKKKIHPRGEAIEAFQENDAEDEDSGLVGTQIVLAKPTAVYRARHIDHRVKSYQGLVTIVEPEPKGGFIRVQFLRQGFGLCDSFMRIEDIIDPEKEKDDNNV